jgi:hypothetical protein
MYPAESQISLWILIILPCSNKVVHINGRRDRKQQYIYTHLMQFGLTGDEINVPFLPPIQDIVYCLECL